MAKYLVKASYTPVGVKGVMKDGGTARVTALEKAISGLGGTLESMYFAFGGDDVYGVAELPDHASAMALAAAVTASGAISSYETVVLLEAAEVDAAMQKAVGYRAPGS